MPTNPSRAGHPAGYQDLSGRPSSGRHASAERSIDRQADGVIEHASVEGADDDPARLNDSGYHRLPVRLEQVACLSDCSVTAQCSLQAVSREELKAAGSGFSGAHPL